MGLPGVSRGKSEGRGIGEEGERRRGGAGELEGVRRLLEGPDLCLFILI
jgi:hypothetical protein